MKGLAAGICVVQYTVGRGRAQSDETGFQPYVRRPVLPYESDVAKKDMVTRLRATKDPQAPEPGS